jgi:putative Mn2+ efflux pump MntP
MKKIIRDILDQAWTLLGMFVAWIVLEGSAKTIVGYCILGTLGLWAISYPFRNSKDKEE